MEKSALKTVSAKYNYLCKKTDAGYAPSQGEEWLLDNYYIIEKAAKDTQKSLSNIRKTAVRKKLLYSLGEEFLNGLGGAAKDIELFDFLEKQQEREPLGADELWLFPVFIKTAAVDKIAMLCKGDLKNAEDMGRLISSLVSVDDIDFEEQFEKLCAIDRVFSENTNDFAEMSDETKSRYRKAVSNLSRISGKSEAEIAKITSDIALGGKDNRRRHIGYYLLGKGRDRLCDALGLKRRHNSASTLYPWSIASITVIIFILSYAVTKSFSASFISLLPALDIAVALSNYIFSRAVKPQSLPSIKFDGKVPDNAKTVIAYPVLLSTPEAVDEICEKLEVCRAANGSENLFFALLGDFTDSDLKKLSADEEIKGRATEKILRLNEKYGDVFYLFVRSREYSRTQQKWMGKERKRGALLALSSFLREGGDDFSVFIGKKENLRDIKYIITLDSDTVLPIGGAEKLIGAAEHPLNRPVTDKERGRVTEGYGIIKPKICIDIESASKTVFSKVYAGLGGTDSYSAAESDIYMDIFGEAIFTGKGIIDIDAFLACTKKAIPDNTVLSHDLLEGSYLRCALCSSAEVYDSYPSAFQSFAKRQHRWIRGDWQLLPWLSNNVLSSGGEKRKNPLSRLSKWKIFDNLRRSFMPAALFFLIGFPYLLSTGNAHFIALLALVTLILPLIIFSVSSIAAGKFKSSSEKRYADVFFGVRACFYQTALSISFLAFNAYLSLDAIIRTVVRVLFTKKNTLQWVTAADAERGKAASAADYYKYMVPSSAAGAAAFLMPLIICREYTGVGAVLGIIWAVAPLLAFFISFEEKNETVRLSDKSRAFLLDTAEKTWSFFANYVSDDENFLPVDNIQLWPFKGVAHRTSPTNIGLYMLAVLGARDLGFIDTDEMEKRLSDTLSTVEKLEKWRGHLLNWYDTTNLKPLYPRYVSTVDSGNFICYLMAVYSGVSEYGGIKSEKIASRIKNIIDGARFSILFNKNKKLFHIGYNIEENRFSPSYYDMLASEARQTCFLSAARGEVKPSAWFKLSRTLRSAERFKGLASWTGTMFEYFMPLILMRTYKNTLLDESLSFALQCQKRYGKKRHIPWGVSESGFFAFDKSMNYQYKAFGAPALGIKRGLSKDTVIAPYASALALPRDVRGATLNLLRLKRMGLFGEYGFFEAADFTPSRVPKGEKFATVKSYMAHHQGMSFASLVNVLRGNIMQKRFEKWPCIRAALPLLQERVPIGAPVNNSAHEKISHVKFQRPAEERCVREFEGEYEAPPMHALSNGVYKVLIDNRGCGTSSLGNITLGRKRPAPDERGRGIMILIKTENGSIKSAYDGKSVFSPHMAEYHAKCGEIESNLSICVLPEENAELRRITLVNKSGKDTKIEITAFTDIALTTYEAEISHSVFAGLFVKTFYDNGTLFAVRKPRDEKEKSYTGFMTARAEGGLCGALQYETSREHMLRRGGDVLRALKENYPEALSGTLGNVLDPCFAMRMTLQIKSGESASADFLTGICENLKTAKQTVNKFGAGANAAAIFEDAYKAERLRPVKLSPNDEKFCLDALSRLYYGGAAYGTIKKKMGENTLPYRELWKFGISGTAPIITVELFDESDTELLGRVISAHEFFRYKGIRSDVVVLCSEAQGYSSPVLDAARDLVRERSFGDIFVLGREETEETDKSLIIAASALYFDGRRGFESALAPFKKKKEKNTKLSERKDVKRDEKLEFQNGYGGFSENGAEYIINQKRCGETPAPWCNVIANESFGTLLSESGGGFTWYKNSREMRLTDWRNDSVSDILQERLEIYDDGGVFSPQAGAFGDTGYFKTVHGIGYTEFQRFGGTDCKMRVFVPRQGNVKIITAKIKNNTENEKRIKAVYKAVPVLGVSKYDLCAKHEAYASDSGVICKNIFEKGYLAFLYTNGENGIVSLESGNKMSASLGESILLYAENSFALQSGEEKEICFLFGAAESENEAAETVAKFKDSFKEAFEDMKKWRAGICALYLQSGQKQIDFLFNNWILYQVTSCRLWGRSAFYQSGGAFGFRDQLQDILPLLLSRADIAKEQILRAAAHQFQKGDVLHWWHEGNTEKGVRTRFSDDRLWLPYVTAEYINVTGDFDILNEKVPFTKGADLKDGESEVYFEISGKSEAESLYSHCKKAIDISLKFGKNGLPLMGSGDWNDGMNNVGAKGSGESVWLCWFLRDVLLKFAPLCRRAGEAQLSVFYEKSAADLKVNANNLAWDGKWFIRAFYDDGAPLGSALCEQCKIDSISQSWAVISEGTDKARAKTAVQSAVSLLSDDKNGIVKLLNPPFSQGGKNPGYIASYPEGVRENGGQYTHAAVWLAISAAMLGLSDEAFKIAEYINPINHTKTDILANTYKTEGYALAADIYSAQGAEGRGGWTWYTGAAAWSYKLFAEYIFGFKKRGDTVTFSPCLPSFLKSFKLTYLFFDTEYFFDVSGGEENKNTEIKLVNDKKRHEIKVVYKGNL